MNPNMSSTHPTPLQYRNVLESIHTALHNQEEARLRNKRISAIITEALDTWQAVIESTQSTLHESPSGAPATPPPSHDLPSDSLSLAREAAEEDSPFLLAQNVEQLVHEWCGEVQAPSRVDVAGLLNEEDSPRMEARSTGTRSLQASINDLFLTMRMVSREFYDHTQRVLDRASSTCQLAQHHTRQLRDTERSFRDTLAVGALASYLEVQSILALQKESGLAAVGVGEAPSERVGASGSAEDKTEESYVEAIRFLAGLNPKGAAATGHRGERLGMLARQKKREVVELLRGPMKPSTLLFENSDWFQARKESRVILDHLSPAVCR